MAMTIKINPSELLADLMTTLARSGCPTAPTATGVCQVRHPLASTEQEEWLEIAFFVRAWELAHPGVAATISR
jgi:hypothetical protein